MARTRLSALRSTLSLALLLASAAGTLATARPTAAPVVRGAGYGVGGGPLPTRSLADFRKPASEQACYDRETEPHTAVVDAHFHPRPFGGPAIPPADLVRFFDQSGVRFVTYFGLGQVLELRARCTYYLDCPGVKAEPSIKNDVLNGMDVAILDHENVDIVLSMTFMDLARPDDVVETIRLYDREFPGMFKWAGEANVIKAALTGNGHVFATPESIARWAPFMQILRERNIPITLHSDLGNDAEPTRYMSTMQLILDSYPENKIVWAHMGLSKELTTMDPKIHVALLRKAFDKYPNFYADISWDVLYESYRQFGPVFVKLINEYPDRILPGTDFVAAGHKNYSMYAHELDLTSRVYRLVSDEAFRKIALGENYFRLLGLPYQAPEICPDTGR
jgi:predicted TIM-barrel fold metal-dependent hydrolase